MEQTNLTQQHELMLDIVRTLAELRESLKYIVDFSLTCKYGWELEVKIKERSGEVLIDKYCRTSLTSGFKALDKLENEIIKLI